MHDFGSNRGHYNSLTSSSDDKLYEKGQLPDGGCGTFRTAAFELEGVPLAVALLAITDIETRFDAVSSNPMAAIGPRGRVQHQCSRKSYPTHRTKVFVSYMHVLSAGFLMGLAAAAPMGPVNMLAIRRGVIGGWRYTLACGIGTVTGDLFLFSLVLLGGHYLFSDLSNPTLRTILTAIGVIVLLPLGIYFLLRAVKDPLRAFASARKRWRFWNRAISLARDAWPVSCVG